jgi:hypothetical protein
VAVRTAGSLKVQAGTPTGTAHNHGMVRYGAPSTPRQCVPVTEAGGFIQHLPDAQSLTRAGQSALAIGLLYQTSDELSSSWLCRVREQTEAGFKINLVH